ncbi:MAG TPA: hypothetical protein VMV70_08675 [Gallionella sp.]|nr:hypothetical protein [Gallionella sp.]
MSEEAVNHIQKGTSRAVKSLKVRAWILIIIGIPLTFAFGLGLIFVGLGITMLSMAKKMSNQDKAQSHLGGVGAVASGVSKGSKT